MPIGSSKIGVLGGKALVPGGTSTFNSPGTFTVPVGVNTVNVTGKGGAGNPGNGAGGSGGCGGGGGGGSTGGFFTACFCKPAPPYTLNTMCFISGGSGGKCSSNKGTRNPVNAAPYPSTGAPGNAGPNGNPAPSGNPGNAGTASTGLCKTFPGGAAGNGGVGGVGGTGGGGGTAGLSANGPIPHNPACKNNSGGAGGSAGGGNGGNICNTICPTNYYLVGGGGAGTTNAGTPGNPTNTGPIINTTRGLGGNPGGGRGGGNPNAGPAPCGNPLAGRPGTVQRAGGGGGGIAAMGINPSFASGGGGGGGGRGNAGTSCNAANPGSAANPTSFNAVAVTPGSSYPISVGSPGGQVVISWNPQ